MNELELLAGKSTLIQEIYPSTPYWNDGVWDRDNLPSLAYGEDEVNKMAEILKGHASVLSDWREGTFAVEISGENYFVMNPNTYYAYYHSPQSEILMEGVVGVEIGEDHVQFNAKFFDSQATLRLDNKGNLSSSLDRPSSVLDHAEERPDGWFLSVGLEKLRNSRMQDVLNRKNRARWDMETVLRGLRGNYFALEHTTSKVGLFVDKVFGGASIQMMEATFKYVDGSVVIPGFCLNPVTRNVYKGGKVSVLFRDAQIAGGVHGRAFFESRQPDVVSTLLVGADASFNLEVRKPVR